MNPEPNARPSTPARILAVCAVALALLATVPGAVLASEDAPPLGTVRIGIVTDGPDSRTADFVTLFREELDALSTGAFAIEVPADAVVDGAWDPDGIPRVMDAMLGRSDLDVLLAVGVAVASEICGREEIATPAVIPFAFEGCATRCSEQPEFRIRSVDLGDLVARDLATFHEITPFHRVAILMDPLWPEHCSRAAAARRLAPEGAELELVTVDGTEPNLADELPPGTDAVYFMPLLRLDDEAFARLAGQLTDRGLPTFSMLGESEVEGGVLAGLNTRATIAALARGAALDVLDLVEGRAGTRAVPEQLETHLTLNMATARALGFSPSWELLTRARLLHDEASRAGRPLDLGTAITRAVDANLDLAVRDRRVAAGAESIREARSAYLPHLEVGLAGVAVDEDHAIGAFGQYARFAAGSLTLTQLLYSEDASANRSIQRELQTAREADWQALRLDIGRAAVAAYTGVLRTGALIRVRQQKVDLTRTNLELARLRRSLGATAAAEVHRWEAELATARADLLAALSLHRSGERQLSRLLDEPLTTRWKLEQPDLPAAFEILGGAEAAPLLETADGYDRLSSTLVAESLDRAPELLALRAAISAQEREWQAARRAGYVPTVGLQAEVDRILAKDTDAGLDLGPVAALVPQPSDTSWTAALQASVPVVTGGAHKARRIRAREELSALEIDLRNTEEKLSQRTLAALDTAVASWSTIALRRQAADAAAQTEELVRDAYARGAASILDLLDAQNSALDARLAAETSVYTFLDDWAEVQRAVARGGGAQGASGTS